jgi:hypothetical protein
MSRAAIGMFLQVRSRVGAGWIKIVMVSVAVESRIGGAEERLHRRVLYLREKKRPQASAT